MISRTIVRLGVRSVFGRRRGILLFALPAGADRAGGAACGCSSAPTSDAAVGTLGGLGLSVIVPLVALLATSGLFATEIDDGSISYLLAKPISRYTIVVSKLVVAVACVVVFAVVPDARRRPDPALRRACASASASPSARWSAASPTARCSRFCRC